MSEVAEVLRKARARIEDPKHWTRGTYARDAKGKPCDDGGADWNAVSFCAVGAIHRTRGEFRDGTPEIELLERAVRDLEGPDAVLTLVNDGRWHERDEDVPRYAQGHHKRVLAAYDRAIELAEEAKL